MPKAGYVGDIKLISNEAVHGKGSERVYSSIKGSEGNMYGYDVSCKEK